MTLAVCENYQRYWDFIEEQEQEQISSGRIVLNEYDRNIDRFSDTTGSKNGAIFVNGQRLNGNKFELNHVTYYATQAPTKKSLDLFFDLLWQENINLVIKLVSDHQLEFGKEGYIQKYAKSKNFKIKIDNEIYKPFTLTKLKVRKENRHKNIKFLSINNNWPDHGVPKKEILQKFFECYNELKETKVLVHCRAGIGRTGTFITLDSLQKQPFDIDKICSTISYIRKYRPSSVSPYCQFAFIADYLDSIDREDL